MVPGPAPKDVLGRSTPETPGANGFELLPPSADSAAAQASAEVNPRGLVGDPSGFQMLPAAQTALAVAPQSFEPSRPSAPFAPVRAGLPTVQADAAADGFKMLPAAPAKVDGAALAAAPATPPAVQPVSLPRTAPTEPVAAPVQRLTLLPNFLLNLRAAPDFAAPRVLAAVSAAQPDIALAPAATPQAPLLLAEQAAPALDARPALASVRAAAPDAELLLVTAPVRETEAADVGPRGASPSHVAAPVAQALIAPVTQPAAAPILIGLSQPIDVLAEAPPAVERAASMERLRRRLPVARLVEAKAETRPAMRLAAASPLFLESFDRPVATGAS